MEGKFRREGGEQAAERGRDNYGEQGYKTHDMAVAWDPRCADKSLLVKNRAMVNSLLRAN
jgi:hypothetical protein